MKNSIEDGDYISAKDVSSFPDQSPTSKIKVQRFLTEIHEKDPKLWSSIKTIADESTVSPVYTRNVLDELVTKQIIEKGYVGKKQYFRLVK